MAGTALREAEISQEVVTLRDDLRAFFMLREMAAQLPVDADHFDAKRKLWNAGGHVLTAIQHAITVDASSATGPRLLWQVIGLAAQAEVRIPRLESLIKDLESNVTDLREEL